MESAPSLETVAQTIHTLYHNQNVTEKEKASFWLGELQRSVHSWEISDKLLRMNIDLETCYFAAQTMRTKVQFYFHELPQSAHQSLRDSLIEHLDQVTPATNHVIVTQLCLAMADLVLQMVSWKNSAQDLIQKFAHNPHHVQLLLDILKVLPEEVNSRHLRLGANRRKEITTELEETVPLVLQLLCTYLDSPTRDPEYHLQTGVYKCLCSWLNLDVIPTREIANSKLLGMLFQDLANASIPSAYHEVLSDCLCAALYCVEDIKKQRELAEVLFKGVLTLPEAYHMSVADEDIDKSINYCRIFTEMAESFLDDIVDSPETAECFSTFGGPTFELLLMCIEHHQYEVAEITFNLWYRLSESLAEKNDTKKEAIFTPFVQRLLLGLCRHCQMEPDEQSIPDDNDDFGHFRNQVSELIKDVIFLVGSVNCFSQMFELLQNHANSTTWDHSEAALFTMTAVARNISPSENEVVPRVVEAVLSLPPETHVAVRYTSTRLVGELCEWIDSHHELLDKVLNFLLAGLQDPRIAPAAAASLLQMCQTCRDKMQQHFDGLVQIIQHVDSFNISNDAAVDLLKGTAMILAKMPPDKICEGLRSICAVQVTHLSQVLNTAGDGGHLDKSDPVIWLDRLAATFRHLSGVATVDGQPHPGKTVVEEIWPLLSQTCDKFQTDVRIVERCCRCIRFAVRCIGKSAASLLVPLVTQMVHLYETHQHSCFLYLGSILVDEFGMEEGCVQGLLDMLQAFMPPTFKILEAVEGFRNHPDTVDDLFRLCTRFVQKAPLALINAPFFKALMHCALAACSLDHRDANASVMKFLQDLLNIGSVDEKPGRNTRIGIKRGKQKQKRVKESAVVEKHPDHQLRCQAAKAIMHEYGPQLIQNLLTAVLFNLPTFMMPDIADVFYAIMLIDRPSVCLFLESALKTLPAEDSAGVARATHKQMVDFHKAVTSAEEAKQVSVALRDFSRLFR